MYNTEMIKNPEELQRFENELIKKREGKHSEKFSFDRRYVQRSPCP